jgi:hypothetical protein
MRHRLEAPSCERRSSILPHCYVKKRVASSSTNTSACSELEQTLQARPCRCCKAQASDLLCVSYQHSTAQDDSNHAGGTHTVANKYQKSTHTHIHPQLTLYGTYSPHASTNAGKSRVPMHMAAECWCGHPALSAAVLICHMYKMHSH